MRAAALLEEAGIDGSRLPAVIRYDGQVVIDPSLPDMARAIGVNVRNDVDSCDVAIVGAGPAGLTTAVYAASEGLETVMLELEVSGGQAGTSPLIRNYPGFPHGIGGGLLMERTCEQAWLMGPTSCSPSRPWRSSGAATNASCTCSTGPRSAPARW